MLVRGRCRGITRAVGTATRPQLQLRYCASKDPVDQKVQAETTHEGQSFSWQVKALSLATTVAGAGGLAYAWQLQQPLAPAVDVDIKAITDDVFDTCDNLFVFFLDKADDLKDRREDLKRTIKALVDESSLSRVRYYHNIRKEGDPPPPEADAQAEAAEGRKPIRVVMYKGQRKTPIYIGSEVPKQQIVDFFAPLSEDLSKVKMPKLVSLVSNTSFDEDVLNASKLGNKMVLLQMYEDTCFLCFLMRPFINSLSKLLSETKVPLVIKRINIEKNDFPDRCPIARGTPTFVLFHGPEVPGTKWEEFKPKELCEKITQVFPGISDDTAKQMDELQTAVTRRFQLFTQFVMWTVELHKLESLVSNASESAQEEDGAFNAVVSQMMSKDMKRVDGLWENIEHLQKEVEEVEHDALLLGGMLAESVANREQEEQERLMPKQQSLFARKR